MKKLVDNILPRLFISMLMMASVLCTRLAVESKTDINCRTLDIKNSTEEDYNHDVAGNRRAVQLPANIFLNPNHNCYRQFLIQGNPPTGLRTQHLNYMRYICQERPNVPGTYYYATMHDERLGIAVYSAYVLYAGNINFQAQGASAWVQTPGIQNQGSNAAYQGQPCHRGHLYPAQTASGHPVDPAASVRSTYQYTNAVPQCAAFNTGQWSQFEGYIRAYAVQTCIPAGGVLYLLTGSSFVGIQGPGNPQPVAVQITTLPGTNIYKPGSMWTAGTCLCGNGLSESFAVIGNNQPVSATQEISQAQLLVILNYDIQLNALKRSSRARRLSLFPGAGSATPISLPREEYPPRGRGRHQPSRGSYRRACSSSSSKPPKSTNVVPSSKPSKKPSSKPSKKPSSKPHASKPHASTSRKSKHRPAASSSRRKSG